MLHPTKMKRCLKLRKIEKSDIIGEEFCTNRCGKCVVIDYQGYYNVTVMFSEPLYITRCDLSSLRSGGIFNPLIPTFYGKGYFGIGKYSSKDKKFMQLWQSVLERCYSEKYKSLFPTYKDVTVCEEWLNFQNFAAWCESQEFYKMKEKNGRNYHLDKDILIKGNKVYSPETCCFVPSEINSLTAKANSIRGKNPLGVYYYQKTDRFIARLRRYGKSYYVGSYRTPEEAFVAYKQAKESYIKEVAEKWRGKIDEKVYQTLMSWEVSIDD